jgi:apolipoprotein N-acyltransferase
VLHFLAFLGFGIWPLAFLSLAPLLCALEGRRGAGLRSAALLGLVFGWVAFAGGYLWLWRIVDVFLAGSVLLGAALWLVYSAWFALRFVLCSLAFQLLRRRGWPVAPAVAAPLLAIEWLYPSLFPVHAGAALLGQPALVQVADLGGPLLLTALVALANAAAVEVWLRLRGRPSHALATAVSACVAVVLAWGYGALRIPQVERRAAAAPVLRVGLVQANLGVLEKRREAVRVHQRYLEESRALLAESGGAEGIDLLIWPETVYIRGIQRPLPVSGELIRADLRVPLLFGAASVRTETGRRLKYNSALLIGADGVVRDAYDKNLLIPIAEGLPLGGLSERVAEALPHVQEFAAATGVPPLHLGPWRISTPICYEVIRPEFVRRMMREAKPHLIVSLANDAWFGDSQEPWLHLALARLRAIEHRRALVRATNSGVSAVVDPVGRVVAHTGLLTREHLRASVPLLQGETLYARLGDWPGWLAVAGLFAAGVVRRRRRGMRPSAPAGRSPR